MRKLIAAFTCLAWMIFAPTANAAPTCLNRSGDTVRCATKGAMPVGWTPSPQQRLNWETSRPASPSTREVLNAFLVIALLLAMIALLPEFDGSRDEDWGRQEDDK